MNSVYRYKQSHLIGASFAIQALAFFLSLSNGTFRPAKDIELLDVIGEGSVMVFALVWIIAAVASRPPGIVTSLMVAGLNCFAFTAILDFLDEVLVYSAAAEWLSMLESMPAAVGMVIMSVGLLSWHKEQKALNKQLQRREWAYRNHNQIDEVTQLYLADYWCERVEDMRSRGEHASALMLDINGFSTFNENHGYGEGNRFLQEIARLLVMHVRENDLVCRYAGDRFIVLLHGLDYHSAMIIADDIETSVHHLAFKSGINTTAVFQSVRTAVTSIDSLTPIEQVVSTLQRQLSKRKLLAAS
ncbi:GGDEF domain-containing protein [Aestuariibacter sp. A3R04]|uniref:GGDEF domain-containing protein n=1 Tax=Aestuariibacter sp. A3R04 TaxID=2841571 RepID=UPI001C088064|nr:GGDEF domain-containing protein [Aestuariibacter sp. A3R04]MBU3022694.1 GGDEF domain-containing protein [Aestuariibacter sp. A3R04]